MTTTAVTTRTIGDAIKQRRPEIKELLPSHVNVDRYLKSAMLAVARNPDLLNCTPISIVTTIINGAELGLDFTPAKGHAYIVPFIKTATFMPGYRGFIELARRSGRVKIIDAQLVFENDVFDFGFGEKRFLIHKPAWPGDRGKMIGAYAMARLDNDELIFTVMNMQELDAIRDRSKAKSCGPWKTDAEEMYRKVPIRRLFKYLPCSPDDEEKIAKLMQYDHDIFGTEDKGLEPGKGRTDALAEMIGAGMAPATDDADFEDVPADDTGDLSTEGKDKAADDGMPFEK